MSLSLLNSVATLDLKCQFKFVNWRYTSGVACIAEDVVIKNSHDIISSVNGRYGTEENTTLFIVKNQKVHKFPSDLNVFFPNLEGIEIFNCSLKSIERSDLKPFEKIKELWLGNNELETLEADLFEFNPELQIIVFNRNRLMHVGYNILVPLPQLSKANFNDNGCIDKYAGTRWQRQELEKQLKKNCLRPKKENDLQKAEDEIGELKARLLLTENKLELSDGNLVVATKHLLESSKKIYKKFVTGDFKNPVVELICKENEEVQRCEAVNLKIFHPHTEIQSIKRENSDTVIVGQIRALTITKQQILYIPSNIANIFSNLTHLEVSLTGIFLIEPHAYENLSKLAYLSLNNSIIHEVPSNVFINLRNLKELDLSFNKIVKIELQAFNGLANLQKLQLNNNLLEEIDGKIFESLRNLLRLSMNNNRLKTIGLGLFSPLTKLKFADFTGNECINTSFPKELQLQEIAIKMRDQC